MSSTFYVYILANTKGRRPVLYVGVTNDLVGRIGEHRTLQSGFTARYNVTTLVYVEDHCDPMQAIVREKQIKGWRREKKIELIRSTNPAWRDLLPPMVEAPSSAPVFVRAPRGIR